jgi:hypothetical protein
MSAVEVSLGEVVVGVLSRDAGIDPDDDLAMLAWLGDDLLGAVRMRVIEATPFRSRRAVAPLVQASEDALYRASLPGAQWKLSLAEGYKGLTLPLKGAAGAWIAKFHSDIVRDAVAREYATMTWARHAGLDVPEIRMVSVDDIAGLPNDVPRGDGGVYLIRRFDRAPKGVRIHTEDFAQILVLRAGEQRRRPREELVCHLPRRSIGGSLSCVRPHADNSRRGKASRPRPLPRRGASVRRGDARLFRTHGGAYRATLGEGGDVGSRRRGSRAGSVAHPRGARPLRPIGPTRLAAAPGRAATLSAYTLAEARLTPAKAVLTPAKAVLTPAKAVLTSAKAVLTAPRAHRTAPRAHRTAREAPRTPPLALRFSTKLRRICAAPGAA